MTKTLFYRLNVDEGDSHSLQPQVEGQLKVIVEPYGVERFDYLRISTQKDKTRVFDYMRFIMNDNIIIEGNPYRELNRYEHIRFTVNRNSEIENFEIVGEDEMPYEDHNLRNFFLSLDDGTLNKVTPNSHERVEPRIEQDLLSDAIVLNADPSEDPPSPGYRVKAELGLVPRLLLDRPMRPYEIRQLVKYPEMYGELSLTAISNIQRN